MASTLLPLAHLGHWYVGGPVFLSPVLAVWLFLKVGDWRDRRRGASPEPSRVGLDRSGGAARVAVRGALDWPALLDLEDELAGLRESESRVEVDLREIARIDRRGAERLADLVDGAGGVAVAVVPASPETATVLRRAGVPVVSPRRRAVAPAEASTTAP